MQRDEAIALLEKQVEPIAERVARTVFAELSQNAEHLARQHPVEYADPDLWESVGVPMLMRSLCQSLSFELAEAAAGWREVYVCNATKEDDG